MIYRLPSALKVLQHAKTVVLLPTAARLMIENGNLNFWVIKWAVIFNVAVFLVCGKECDPLWADWKKTYCFFNTLFSVFGGWLSSGIIYIIYGLMLDSVSALVWMHAWAKVVFFPPCLPFLLLAKVDCHLPEVDKGDV